MPSWKGGAIRLQMCAAESLDEAFRYIANIEQSNMACIHAIDERADWAERRKRVEWAWTTLVASGGALDRAENITGDFMQCVQVNLLLRTQEW